MRIQKILLFLFLGTWSFALQAQTQIGKHSVVFYPLSSDEKFSNSESPLTLGTDPFILNLVREKRTFFGGKDFRTFLGLGYHYQFKPDWGLDLKLFARQNLEFFDGSTGSISSTNKMMKLGLQYFCVNKKLQVSLGLYYYFRDGVYQVITFRGVGNVSAVYQEREMGAELGIGLAYPFAKHFRIMIGSAFRYSFLKRKAGTISFFRNDVFFKNQTLESFLPFESLGLAYVF